MITQENCQIMTFHFYIFLLTVIVFAIFTQPSGTIHCWLCRKEEIKTVSFALNCKQKVVNLPHIQSCYIENLPRCFHTFDRFYSIYVCAERNSVVHCRGTTKSPVFLCKGSLRNQMPLFHVIIVALFVGYVS